MWKKTAVELEKRVTSYIEIFRKYSYVGVLPIDGGAGQRILGHIVVRVRERTNPTTWNYIFKLERQSRGAWRTRNLLPLRHTVVRAPKSPSQDGGLSD